jgi:hypothetical protein
VHATSGQRRKQERRYVETEQYLEAVQRMLRALGRRVGDADIEMLADLDGCRATIDEIVTLAARQLHDQYGYSWARIGAALGMSKQAAHQRLGRQRFVDAASADDTERDESA